MRFLLARRYSLIAGLGMMMGLLYPQSASAEMQTGSKPNVVIILADDLGYGQVSSYPQKVAVETPNIDRLADSGIRMTDGYSQHPMCWPSRASLLSGKYHQRFPDLYDLPKNEQLIGHYLWDAGYVTACIGKWHNSKSPGEWDGVFRNHPLGRGFDVFFGFLQGGHDYFKADKAGGRWGPQFVPTYSGIKQVKEVDYLTTEFTNQALDFIAEHRNEPFFLYLPYNAVHSPMQAPEKYLKARNATTIEDTVHAMLDVMDEGVGQILDLLEDYGLRDNTLVMFIGDNGGWFPNGNWNLRGYKGVRYEGGIRVPYIISWPKELPQNQTYEQPVMMIDVLPTVVAAVGGTIPAERPVDGKNLLPYLKGSETGPPHHVCFWWEGDRFAVRKGDWKLVRDLQKQMDPTDSLQKQLKTWYGGGNHQLGKMELYNLKRDVGEQKNLIEQNRSIANELLRLHTDWRKVVQPPTTEQ